MLSPATSQPACPTPAETVAVALERIVPLQGLSFEERLWLANHGTEVIAQPGDILFEESAPAERMILVLKGDIHVRRQRGGSMELFIGRTGQMTGLLPFSRMKTHGGQGVAITSSWALLIHKSVFPEMLLAIPSMAQRCVSVLLDRVREVTRIEQQAEKLTALGKLAGNLAHELNNPASAASAPPPAWSRNCAPTGRIVSNWSISAWMKNRFAVSKSGSSASSAAPACSKPATPGH